MKKRGDRCWGVRKRKAERCLCTSRPNCGAVVPSSLLRCLPTSHQHSHTIRKKARLRARCHCVCFCALQGDTLYSTGWPHSGQPRSFVSSVMNKHAGEVFLYSSWKRGASGRFLCEFLWVFRGCWGIQMQSNKERKLGKSREMSCRWGCG